MMIAIDELTQNFRTDVDDGDGYFYLDKRIFTAFYEINKLAITENRVIKEYPNGGKDVETVIVKPEEGTWTVFDSFGRDITGMVDIPDYILKKKNPGSTEFIADVTIFHQWTKEELDRQEAEKLLEEERIRLVKELKSVIKNMDSVDDAVCALYEENLILRDIVNSQDDAICTLYEMIGG